MKWLWNSKVNQSIPELTSSRLYDESTFYKKFIKDLSEAKEEVIIESPFITLRRLDMLKPCFEKLVRRSVKVFILTKDPYENERALADYAEEGIQFFERLRIQVLLINGGHHRKLAIIDRKVLWEGSLNILSQYRSREIMRRIESKHCAIEMLKFLQFNKVI